MVVDKTARTAIKVRHLCVGCVGSIVHLDKGLDEFHCIPGKRRTSYCDGFALFASATCCGSDRLYPSNLVHSTESLRSLNRLRNSPTAA